MSLLHQLEEIKRAEKSKKGELQKLKKNFYSEVYSEIQEMKKEARELMEKGDVDKAGKVINDVKKIEKSFNQIINDRLRKILLFTIRSDTRSVKNLTPEEEVLYYEVKESVERFKASISGVPKDIPPVEKAKGKEEKVEVQEEEEYVLVRVVAPTVKFAYVGRDYALKKEDVLHLPKRAFQILSKKNMVEEVKLSS